MQEVTEIEQARLAEVKEIGEHQANANAGISGGEVGFSRSDHGYNV